MSPTETRGRKLLLTDRTHQLLVDSNRLDGSLKIAAAHAGVGMRTVQRWIAAGLTANETALETGYNPFDDNGAQLPDDDTDHTRRFWRLWRDMETARADFRLNLIGEIYKAGRPHEVTKTTTTIKTLRDGTVVQTTVTEAKMEQAWMALAWIAERQWPADYARPAQRMELSGPGGGPVELRDPQELRDAALANLGAAADAVARSSERAVEQN